MTDTDWPERYTSAAKTAYLDGGLALREFREALSLVWWHSRPDTAGSREACRGRLHDLGIDVDCDDGGGRDTASDASAGRGEPA